MASDRAVKHPRELGFELGMILRVSTHPKLTVVADCARTMSKSGIVYVALFSDGAAVIKKGDALRVGQTNRTLAGRWHPIAGTFTRKNLRHYERDDRRKWFRAARGKHVEVWMKAAQEKKIRYPGMLTEKRFSIRCAEEEFLDWYYEPLLGRPLNRGE